MQTLAPIADVSNTGWVISGTTTVWQALVANDADTSRINAGTSQTCRVRVAAGIDPGVHTGHQIGIVAKAAVGTGTITPRLYQGGTLIATGAAQALTAAYATYTFAVDPADAANISDYTDLRVDITGTPATFANVAVTQAYLSLPDPVATGRLAMLI